MYMPRFLVDGLYTTLDFFAGTGTIRLIKLMSELEKALYSVSSSESTEVSTLMYYVDEESK